MSWRPIETAPKDGTRIKLKRMPFGRTKHLEVEGHYSHNVYDFKTGADTREIWKIYTPEKQQSFSGDTNLIGWMPLPEPPVQP